MQAKGIEEFREAVVQMASFLQDRVSELREWNDVKLLTVRVDRLRRWYRPGLLSIGDAAHAMSPVAGLGVNLAIQDAVAAANILAEPLRAGVVGTADLARIQRRREFPARVTQRVQAAIRRQVGGSLHLWTGADVVADADSGTDNDTPRLRTRFIGIGIRPEHVKTPDIQPSN